MIDNATLSFETDCCSFNGSLYAGSIGAVPNVTMLVVQDTPDYTVEVIDATADLPFSAILGLGSSSPTLNDTFLDSMVHSGLVDTKTFSIWLSGDSGGKTDP